MRYQRKIDLNQLVSRKSCFLLGPRQTGKSSLIRDQLPNKKLYNLLEVDTFRSLSRRPSLLREEANQQDDLIIIDEVQLIPELLNEAHLLIEERGTRFLFTGSSARKLRRKGVNLLGGRASWKTLHPFVRSELGMEFSLQKALTRGLLPPIYSSDQYLEDLRDYIEVYLREEIAAETAIRQLPVFSRFLDVAALCNSQIVNYTNIGSDTQISPTTVREYFQVLQDTLIISRLPAWRESKKRKATARDKFYFFDIGIARYLQGRKEIVPGTEDFGSALESYIYHELSAYSSYVSREALAYWRSTSNFEVDFILGDHTAIEIKSSNSVSERHLKGLQALMDEGAFRRYLLVSLDPRERTLKGCSLMYIDSFLDRLWAGEFS